MKLQDTVDLMLSGNYMERFLAEYSTNLEKLKLISKLKYNWDLYGAEPISKDLIDIMRNLIYGLKYQPEIFPTACNSIQFEYEKKNGDYLEFELVDEETVKIFKLYNNETEKYSSCRPNVATINKVLNEFYEGGERT